MCSADTCVEDSNDATLTGVAFLPCNRSTDNLSAASHVGKYRCLEHGSCICGNAADLVDLIDHPDLTFKSETVIEQCVVVENINPLIEPCFNYFLHCCLLLEQFI